MKQRQVLTRKYADASLLHRLGLSGRVGNWTSCPDGLHWRIKLEAYLGLVRGPAPHLNPYILTPLNTKGTQHVHCSTVN